MARLDDNRAMRRFGWLVALTVLLPLAQACQSAPPVAPAAATPAAIDRDLLDVTVAKLHQFYDAKTYTVTQVVQWHLDRIDRYNGVYGAIEQVYRTDALAEAARQDAATAGATGGAASRGALWGVPIVIKANTSIAGKVTTAGWAGFTKPGHELIAPKDAAIVAKFKAAGAIILGHTNMPDLANSDTNRSSSFGRTGNAYDVRFSPGGSSGGTVTAVAANFAVLGNGTDTGNSIRMPAATSALVGVFPTRGLVSIAGIAPLDWLLDNTGPIARTTADAAIALAVMAGPDPLDARTAEAPADAQAGPFAPTLAAATLKGKRFAVPAFILAGDGIPFHGNPANVPAGAAETPPCSSTTRCCRWTSRARRAASPPTPTCVTAPNGSSARSARRRIARPTRIWPPSAPRSSRPRSARRITSACSAVCASTSASWPPIRMRNATITRRVPPTLVDHGLLPTTPARVK
jgi:hypothetical protein